MIEEFGSSEAGMRKKDCEGAHIDCNCMILILVAVRSEDDGVMSRDLDVSEGGCWPISFVKNFTNPKSSPQRRYSPERESYG